MASIFGDQTYSLLKKRICSPSLKWTGGDMNKGSAGLITYCFATLALAQGGPPAAMATGQHAYSALEKFKAAQPGSLDIRPQVGEADTAVWQQLMQEKAARLSLPFASSSPYVQAHPEILERLRSAASAGGIDPREGENLRQLLRILDQCKTCSTIIAPAGPRGTNIVALPAGGSARSGAGATSDAGYLMPKCGAGKPYFKTATQICLSKQEVADDKN